MKRLDVAVLLVTRGSEVLMVWNSNWACFTLPMSKRRPIGSSARVEDWYDTAARVAVECLGVSSTIGDGEPGPQLREVAISDLLLESLRDGERKKYRLQVYHIAFPTDVAVPLVPGVLVHWLRPDDILDKNRRPISPTARDVIQAARERGVL